MFDGLEVLTFSLRSIPATTHTYPGPRIGVALGIPPNKSVIFLGSKSLCDNFNTNPLLDFPFAFPFDL